MPCHRSGYEKRNMHTPATQIQWTRVKRQTTKDIKRQKQKRRKPKKNERHRRDSQINHQPNTLTWRRGIKTSPQVAKRQRTAPELRQPIGCSIQHTAYSIEHLLLQQQRQLTVLKCRSERVILASSKEMSTLSFVNPSSQRPHMSFTFRSTKLVIANRYLVPSCTSTLVYAFCVYASLHMSHDTRHAQTHTAQS